MNALPTNDAARQDARTWSQQLGRLAALQQPARPEIPHPRHGSQSAPALHPTPLHAVLSHVNERPTAQEHATDKLRIHDLLAT